ncbi:hypothetical protein F4703DRAFT_1847996 [Phycomyces blakesleeanus]
MTTTKDRESEGSQTSSSDIDDVETNLMDPDNEAPSGSMATPSTTQGSATRTRRPRYRFDNDGTCRRNELLLQQVLALCPFMAPHGGALRLWEQIADHCNNVQDLHVTNPKDPILTAHNARVHFKDLMTRYGKEGIAGGPHEEPTDTYQKILADVYHQWKSVQNMKSEKQLVLGKRTPGQRMDDIGSRAKQRQIVSNPHTNERHILSAGTRDDGRQVMHPHPIQPHPIQPHPIQPHPPSNIHHYPHLHPRPNVRIAPEPQHIQPAPPPIRIRQMPSPPSGVHSRQSQNERVSRSNRQIETAQPRTATNNNHNNNNSATTTGGTGGSGQSSNLPAKSAHTPQSRQQQASSTSAPAQTRSSTLQAIAPAPQHIAPAPIPTPTQSSAPPQAPAQVQTSSAASTPVPVPVPVPEAHILPPGVPSLNSLQPSTNPIPTTETSKAVTGTRTERELLEAILSHLQRSEERKTKRAEEAAQRSKEIEQLEASREAQRKEDADGRERRFQELMAHMQQSTLAVLARLAELQAQLIQR